ncbi:Alpha/Beta hydrolase protein [Gorgonomyces haynaldii]|nr:Alpha/Beta hydrolase protein [Gorgonomyces haynaldii]
MISAPIRSIGYEHLKRLWLRRQPKRVVKDIDFGSENPKVLLDIYPTKVSRMDHVSYRSDRPNRRPVILFFYGGGWRSGSKNMYEPLGYTLSELGYVVVIPDYGKFPQANAEMMVQDVQLAMAWTLRNIKLYGGDPDNIVVLGHSAGAHLTTLAVLWHAHDQCLGRPNFLQLERLYGLVLVASPFDLNDHFEHEASRGVEQLGCMERLFGKDYDRYSPTRILNGLDKRWVNSNVFNQHCPQNWLLLHTLTDIVVPFSSSFKFCSALQQNHFDGVALKHYRSPGHADLIVDLMLPATLERSKFEDDMGEFYVHAERLTRYHNYVREQSSQNLAYVSYAQFTLQDVKGPSPAR